MKNLIRLILAITALVLFPIFARIAYAAPPSFPSCLNPQGTLKVQYDSGTHGIVGDVNIYSGTDAVYSISDDSLLQCFCPESGAGIQTNWWKAENMEVDTIVSYQGLGWILVPSGEAWGLNSEEYLAQNSNYACKGGNGGGSSSSNSSSGSSSSSSPSGGSSIGDVLALAFTGNIILIYSTAFAGLILIIAGTLVGKKTNRSS